MRVKDLAGFRILEGKAGSTFLLMITLSQIDW
jgi:hypothetical protein